MRYLIIFLFLLSNVICSGQEQEEDIYTIKTKDKQLIFGKLQKITADSIIIDSELLGVMRFSRDQITSFRKGKFSFSFPNNGEPYFVQTGIPNGKGNHYYRNYAVFGQHFSFGINNHLDVTTGFELISIIFPNGNNFPVSHLGAKYSGSLNEKFHVGLSSKLYFNTDGGIILFNMPITLGGQRTNITVSPGYGRSLDGFDTFFFPFYNFNIGLSNRLRIVSDGIIVNDNILATTMMEIKTNKKVLISLGIIHSNEFQILPNIALTVPFGSANKN